MSNLAEKSVQETDIKDNFYKKIKEFHMDCIGEIQKTNEYRELTNKKLSIRNLLITKYNVEESIIDELIETTDEINSFEYEYVDYNIPEIFFSL